MTIPQTREITKETAVEFDTFGNPIDDGKDLEGWEYITLNTICGKIYRVPTRKCETPQSFSFFGWLKQND